MQSQIADRNHRGNNDQLFSSAKEIDADQEIFYTRLRTQVEFYFSPKNLSRDTYLRNMLTSEHMDMPTPRPEQYMCPMGIITNFPKVKDLFSQFSPRLQKEPVALLLARALDGSSNNIVTVSSDGNWIGPANQILPPPTMVGVLPAGMEVAVGQLPPRIPHQFQTQGYQHQQQGGSSMSNPMHGITGVPPPPPPPPLSVQQQHQRGYGQGSLYQKRQEHGVPIATAPSPMGSESPSSTSLESLPQHQQQQAYVSNLPLSSSKISVGGTQSAASLSSMSDTGAKGSIPFMGSQGVRDELPSGPSAPSPEMADHNANTLHLNTMPQPIQRAFPPFHPWPGGMQHQPQPYPFYHPQQVQQSMYPQQGGAPQQMQPYPAYSQMGFAVPHPSLQQHSYPPPFLPYHGMQQYVDYGGGGMQYHGYHPPPPHPSQFHDNRYVDAPGYFQSNDQHQHYGGGGQKMRVEKKKNVKNNQHQNQQHQQHYHHQQLNHPSDSYFSSTLGTTESKNNESDSHQNLHRRASRSPPIGEHHRGNGGNKFKKSVEQNPLFRNDHGNVTPSGFNKSPFNRQKQQHHHSDRASLKSDAIPPTTSSRQQQRQIKADEIKEIFTSSDFPGLEGRETEKLQGDKQPSSNLVGYASALLKKKDISNAEESKPNVSKGTATVSIQNSAQSLTMKKAENQDKKREEAEQELQTGLQELCLVENDGHLQANNDQREQSHGHVNVSICETEVCNTSTSAALVREQPVINIAISTSPVRPDNGEGEVKIESENSTSNPLSTTSQPVINVFNSDEFPAREASDKIDDVAAGGSLPPRERVAQPSEMSNVPRVEKPNPPGAWGGRRLFADVIKDQR